MLDNPQVRQGITAALGKYTNFYKNGTVPPEAVDWGNTDNNIAFLSRTTLTRLAEFPTPATGGDG